MEEKRDSEIRRLVLAKMLYLHGCTHASRKDDVSRMLAIHHFDSAVEMVLRCVATKRGIKSGKKTLYFEDFLQKIDDVPLKDQMSGLHKLRNAVHKGMYPRWSLSSNTETTQKISSGMFVKRFLVSLTREVTKCTEVN